MHSDMASLHIPEKGHRINQTKNYSKARKPDSSMPNASKFTAAAPVHTP